MSRRASSFTNALLKLEAVAGRCSQALTRGGPRSATSRRSVCCSQIDGSLQPLAVLDFLPRQFLGVKFSTATSARQLWLQLMQLALRQRGRPEHRVKAPPAMAAPAADLPPHTGVNGGPVGGQQERHSAARRPRRRSEAKVAERQAKFEEKRRRRAFFGALPFIGAYIRRVEATGGNGDVPMPSGAADGAQLGSAEPPAAIAAEPMATAVGAPNDSGGMQPHPLTGGKRTAANGATQRRHRPAARRASSGVQAVVDLPSRWRRLLSAVPLAPSHTIARGAMSVAVSACSGMAHVESAAEHTRLSGTWAVTLRVGFGSARSVAAHVLYGHEC